MRARVNSLLKMVGHRVDIEQESTKKFDTHLLVTINMTNSSQCSSSDLEEALSVLEGRWKPLIIFHLFSAPVLRFSEIRRAIPGISQKMLIQQLRALALLWQKN